MPHPASNRRKRVGYEDSESLNVFFSRRMCLYWGCLYWRVCTGGVFTGVFLVVSSVWCFFLLVFVLVCFYWFRLYDVFFTGLCTGVFLLVFFLFVFFVLVSFLLVLFVLDDERNVCTG